MHLKEGKGFVRCFLALSLLQLSAFVLCFSFVPQEEEPHTRLQGEELPWEMLPGDIGRGAGKEAGKEASLMEQVTALGIWGLVLLGTK